MVEDGSVGSPADDRDELIEDLRDRVRSLERRLDEGEESRRRADTTIAQLMQINSDLTDRLRELEVPPGPPREVAPEEPFRLRATSGIVAWVGGILSPLAISVLSAQDARYRAALVFAVLAGVGVFLIGIAFYSGFRVLREAPQVQRTGVYSSREDTLSAPPTGQADGSPSERGMLRSLSLRVSRSQWAVLLAFVPMILVIMAWIGYLVWHTYLEYPVEPRDERRQEAAQELAEGARQGFR